MARRACVAGVVLLALAAKTSARVALPEWLQHVVAASTVESALYRVMQLHGVQVLYPRPPKEAQGEIAKLTAAAPDNAELYQLRAQADEQALDEAAAERDWKLYATHGKDPVAAKLELADFYQRRMLYPQAIATLNEVAAAPAAASETYLDPSQQRSWKTFELILTIIHEQGMPASETTSTFNAFLARYPDQPAIYAALLQFQLEQHDWNGAASVIASYRRQFPQEDTFPLRAQALLEFRRGNLDAALAVYDHAFQAQWNPELIQSYLALLDQAHRQRAFVAAAREQLAAHPDGPLALNALARIFYYDQQGGRSGAALQTLEAFRVAREARKGLWSAEDLSTLAQLSTSAGSYAEAARYDYALAATAGTLPNGEPAAQRGLVGLIHILIAAPAQPLAVGAGNLTLYRDLATLDQGPGYWNGILSLWLNGESLRSEYAAETAKAQGYFERSKGAELLADLDKRFPNSPERAALHAELIGAMTQYGQPAAVISAGKQFLAAFPAAPERLQVGESMADAYAQQNDTQSEFALYESQLTELAAKTGGFPLTAAAKAPPVVPDANAAEFVVTVQNPEAVDANAGAALQLQSQPLVLAPARKPLPEATAFAQVLERYLGRLTATNQLPRALTVLRQQLDRNPNDPLLYERLSSFLQQNNLSAQQEQVFELAIAKFQQPDYYDKLARFYLRSKRRDAFAKLTRQVTDIFSGTDLDAYFANVAPDLPVGPQLAVELNLYAAKRFPHDAVFTRNLLRAYQAPGTKDAAAYEALLRRQWWVSDDMRDEFVTYLSRTGKLQAELSELQTASSTDASANPAAIREAAEIDIFTAHFEQAAPLLDSVVTLYPADADTGDRAISLFRSLAYLDPTPASTAHAVAIEKNLLAFTPDNANRLATLGDLYAEATSNGGEDLASAALYWHQIPDLHPGSTQGFLTSSTIFWDYFQFDEAMAELTKARMRFHSKALFGYEAGAIAENRHDLDRAAAEYTNAVIHPIEVSHHFDSGVGVIQAWLRPPSDAADSNLRSTALSFLGSEESQARLLQLATRDSARSAVENATAKAVAANPSSIAALTLRADILSAQHHPPELTPLLTTLFSQALDRTSTLEEAAAVGELAQARSLTLVYERSLAKQAALTLDPVQKIQLQYSLAQSMETRNNVSGATEVMGAVYKANARLLGVVRATTDFYGRTKQPQRAISTLLEAAKVAAPPLVYDFTLEAADRANQADDTAQARTLALSLLAQTPEDARVLSVVADSYARARDDAGLKQFYLAQLDAAAKAPGLDSDTRRQNLALLRRGLIPALTRLHDTKGAADQYIALLSAYPEDANTGQEAALYALKHETKPQLLEFLRTTVKQSPRDFRFMVLLAQVETTFEDLPAAESSYSLAIAIRKDRADLYIARANIEILLSQSDPSQSELAAADFQRLYLLSYHDPAWMVRLAELRARQGRASDAVDALKTAYITGHAETADDFFTVAKQLADWNLLLQARIFVEHGVVLAGSSLLTPKQAYSYPEPALGAAVYARILARLGMADQALMRLTEARNAADISANSPSVLAAEVEKQGYTGDDAASFRANFMQQQTQAADRNLRTAVQALGEAVQTWYTPEQKQTLAQSLDKLHDAQQPNSNPELALQVATAAGLADREAEWRKQNLIAGPLKQANVRAYAELQQRRLQFPELAQTLEHYAARLLTKFRHVPLVQAVHAYRDAGDLTNEMRLNRSLVLTGEDQLRNRYFSLLLAQNHTALNAVASSNNKNLANAALNYIVSHGTGVEALAAVAERGQVLPPVWHTAAASLVETYFADPTTSDSSVTDFTASLDSELTIGDRLATHVDPRQQLTGKEYYFYASRFGIFLSTVPKVSTRPEAEDFLAGELEGAPTSPAPYLDLARTYVEAKNIPAAIAEYNHALELSPVEPAILDELATVLYSANRRDEAKTQWSSALTKLRRMQQQAMYPETWFTSMETIIRHLGERQLIANFRADLETILAPYFAKNGNYRSNELLQSIYSASSTSAEGVSFLMTLASAAPEPDSVLQDLNGATWLDASSREAILLRRIELSRKTVGMAGNSGQQLKLQLKLINLYLSEGRVTQAQTLLDAISDKKAVAVPALMLAVRTHRLESLLGAWRTDPDSAPGATEIAAAISGLLTVTPKYKPDVTTIRPLQEFLFEQKDQSHALVPTDFLSLAQARIDTHDIPGALELLQRLARLPASSINNANLSGDAVADTSAPLPYANIDHAAALLEHAHLPAEAVPFLRSLVRLTPWESSYSLRLALALKSSNSLDEARKIFVALARDAAAPYDLRIQSARSLAVFAPDSSAEVGSGELALIVHPTMPQAARQPYFAAARMAMVAASISTADKQMLLREAIAIQPKGRDADYARLDLLLLQPDMANSSMVLALYVSLQNSPPAAPIVDDEADATDISDEPASDVESGETSTHGRASHSPDEIVVPHVSLPLAASRLDTTTSIRLASQLSVALEREDDITSAASYAQLAVELATSSTSNPSYAIAQRFTSLKTALLFARRNAPRQPIFDDTLAQAVSVRPHLSVATLKLQEAP